MKKEEIWIYKGIAYKPVCACNAPKKFNLDTCLVSGDEGLTTSSDYGDKVCKTCGYFPWVDTSKR